MANSEWQRMRLDEVCEKITDGAHFSPKEDPNGLPMASVKDLTRFGVEMENCKRIPQSDFDALVKQGCAPQKGDVLIAKDGNSALDTVCVYNQDDEIVLLSSVAILRPSKLITSDFLNYFLDSPITRQNLKDNFRSGSAIPRVVLKDFRRYPISIPSLETQGTIGSYLRALDDKIALNRQLNATLEQLARSLFQSWFVDFDPVRAKASGEPEESICRRLGLTPELLSLFPATFQSSAMGEIPAGWKITSIGEAVDVVGGGTPSTAIEEYWHKGTYHWATPKDLSGLNSPMLLDTDRKITEKGVRNISSGLLPRDTVLLSSRAPVGYLAISAVPIAINQGFIALRCNGPVTPYYAYMWCLDNMAAIKSRASGTTFLEISKKSFRPMPVLIPDKQIMLEFTALVELLFNQIEEGATEAVTLASLRDELLPKLLSGQIKIS